MRFAQRFGFGASIFFFVCTALLAAVALIAAPVALVQGQFAHALIALLAGGFWSLMTWTSRQNLVKLRRRNTNPPQSA